MANTLRFKRGLASGIPTALAGEPLFTTDTFDLYIGTGAANQRFQKYIASGTTLQYLRGDGSLATFPTNIITGTGTTNYLPKFTGASALGDSLLQEGTRAIGLNVTPSAWGITDWRALQINFGYLVANSASFAEMGANAYNDGTNYRYIAASQASTRYRQNTGSHEWHYSAVGSAGATITYTQAARITSGGNFIINNASTDNGLRFQVTGDGYFSGSVGIGAVPFTGATLYLGKSITGATNSYGSFLNATILADVTASATGYYSLLGTAASTTIGNINNFFVVQSAFGAGSVVTNQFGFHVHSSMTGATNNYGFYGNIASGTGRWNLYMNGTAANYLAGSLGIGSTSLSNTNLNITKNLTGSTNTYGIFNSGSIRSDVTFGATMFSSSPSIQNAVFTLSGLKHFEAVGISSVGSATIATQFGFFVESTLSGATTNYGFYGNIAAATGRWNIFMDGTANNFMRGSLLVGTSTTPTGEALQVNGTMKVTGASTFGGTITSSNYILATAPASSYAYYLYGRSSDNYGAIWFGSNNGATRYGYIQSGSPYGGTMAFVGDGGGRIDLDNRGITGTGAATFSSSVTAASALLSSGGNGLSLAPGAIGFNRNVLTGAILNSGGFAYQWNKTNSTTNTSDLLDLQVYNTSGTFVTNAISFNGTGAATFSSSITALSLIVDTTTFVVDATNNRVGVGTNVPTSSLHVVGSVTKSHTTKTANYTATESDYTILCNTTGGGFTITLPAASGCSGRIYVIKKTIGNSGVNNVTIDGNASETIDGSATIALQCRSSVMIQSDGSNWWILSQYADNSCI